VKRRVAQLADWLDHRAGLRTLRSHLLDERLPGGTGWWFTTGSVLLFLLGLQFASGVLLTFYYVPSPASAYDSVRYVMEQVTFGSLVRGLHYFGASFIVVAAVVHMLRVVIFGSYKRPRELTWIVGVLLLLLILAFALTGYLLPWDQKAYWATVVTINVARSGPFGEQIAGVLRGGDTLGALTLLRWYSAHVFLLPAALVTLTVAHLVLMRRHGISGPITPSSAPARPFYPYHALKDTFVVAAVFALLLTFALTVPAPLDAIADPSDGSYVPRPEWYFLALFQLLKYFPGPLEPIATIVLPGLVVGGLLALPFLDRGPDRHPRRRAIILASFGTVLAGIVALTYLGLRDAPPERIAWTPLAIAGQEFAGDTRCLTCHRAGGVAMALEETRLRKDPAWLVAHVRDPEVIAPGLRPVPSGALSDGQAQAIVSFMRARQAGPEMPSISDRDRTAALVLGRYCANCHMIDGAGASSAPDLSKAGATRDAMWLRAWIANPEAVEPFATMPAFEELLTEEELDAVATYLATRK
jgi:ubiquinol-cytochrome c reductase cytochrome b subunit